MDYNEIIAGKIKQLRDEKGISQKDFGEMVGYNQRTVSFWEKGSVKPDLNALHQISKKTGKPVAWFFNESTNDSPVIQQTYDRQLQEQILQNLAQLEKLSKLDELTFIKKTIESLEEKIKSQLPQSPKWNNVIPMPIQKPNKLKLISQPIGAGKIWAGNDSDSVASKVLGELNLETKGKPEYAIRVKGLSMEPDILDGSLILVRTTNLRWKDGDIVVAYLSDSDEWTVKQAFFSSDRKRIKLMGTFGKFEIKEAANVEIQGIVEDIIKSPEEVNELLLSVGVLTDFNNNHYAKNNMAKSAGNEINIANNFQVGHIKTDSPQNEANFNERDEEEEMRLIAETLPQILEALKTINKTQEEGLNRIYTIQEKGFSYLADKLGEVEKNLQVSELQQQGLTLLEATEIAELTEMEREESRINGSHGQ